jgi:hypothetical protein
MKLRLPHTRRTRTLTRAQENMEAELHRYNETLDRYGYERITISDLADVYAAADDSGWDAVHDGYAAASDSVWCQVQSRVSDHKWESR